MEVFQREVNIHHYRVFMFQLSNYSISVVLYGLLLLFHVYWQVSGTRQLVVTVISLLFDVKALATQNPLG